MMYRLLTVLLFPLLVIYTIKISIKFKSLRYLKQRLGTAYPAFNAQPIWIHCASVGEVITFMPLLEILIKRLPQQAFLITTNTVTGAAILEKHAPRNTQPGYLPIENKRIINIFLNQVQPKLALIMETEIWPLLYKTVNQKKIPLSIINARLSHKTLNTNRWVKKLYQHTLQYVDCIFARSEQDLNLFKQLGYGFHQSLIAGNLKFSQTIKTQPVSLKNFTQRDFVLAASTHNDEELKLAELWQQNNFNKTLLVIAPRHPDRSDDIIKKISAAGLEIAIRSKGNAITDNTDIYLADTLGELTGFMDRASVIFMGGSLIPHGGQNFLEAARLNKAIVMGPYMHNFQNEVDLFNRHHACVQVKNITELGDTIQSLLTDVDARIKLETNARQLMDQQTNIAQVYLTELEQHYPKFFN